MGFIVFTYRPAMSCLQDLSFSVSAYGKVLCWSRKIYADLNQLVTWFADGPYCLLIYNIRPRASCHEFLSVFPNRQLTSPWTPPPPSLLNVQMTSIILIIIINIRIIAIIIIIIIFITLKLLTLLLLLLLTGRRSVIELTSGSKKLVSKPTFQ